MKSLQTKRMNYLSYSIAVAIGMAVSLPALSNETKGTETIVITGERMDKSLKDTTTAVTVIGEEQLENGEKTSINDIATSAPNVVTAGYESISIRGIEGTGVATGGQAFYSGSRARVSTIVDGVAQAWLGQGYTPSKSWDVKQVEVLRGPQSTNQGTNSIGGALVVQTNDPTYYWETKLRAGFETYENGNVKNNLALVTSGPLIQDELAFRLALDGNKGDGWMNYAQTTNELENAPDIEESENLNARLKLLWEPSAIPGLSAKLTYNRHTYKGEYLTFASAEYVQDPTLVLYNATKNSSNTRLQDSVAQSIAADIDYDFAEGITNSLHVAYLTSDVEFEQYPVTTTYVTSQVDNVTIENRVLLQKPNSDFSTLIGLYYSNLDTETQVAALSNITGKTETSAVYGETTYTVNSAFKLVGGARFENEEFEHIEVGRADDEDKRSNNILLPKVGAIYYVDDTTTLNTSIRKGYNAGGHALDWYNTPYEYYEYDEETVIAYEAGLIKEFERGQLSTNLFYNDYSGYQALVNRRVENIDESRTYGIELAGSIWATTSTQLRASAGYLETEIVKDSEAESGLELPNAPSTNLSAGFTQYIGQNFSFGADVTYVGKYYSDLDNTEDYTAGDYFTADARLQYTIGDFTLDGYVTNLTDEDVIYQYQVSSGTATKASVGQTRTFGLNATYRM